MAKMIGKYFKQSVARQKALLAVAITVMCYILVFKPYQNSKSLRVVQMTSKHDRHLVVEEDLFSSLVNTQESANRDYNDERLGHEQLEHDLSPYAQAEQGCLEAVKDVASLTWLCKDTSREVVEMEAKDWWKNRFTKEEKQAMSTLGK